MQGVATGLTLCAPSRAVRGMRVGGTSPGGTHGASGSILGYSQLGGAPWRVGLIILLSFNMMASVECQTPPPPSLPPSMSPLSPPPPQRKHVPLSPPRSPQSSSASCAHCGNDGGACGEGQSPEACCYGGNMFEGLCFELRHLAANCSQPDVKIVYCSPSQPPALPPSPASPPALPLPPFSPPPPVGAKSNMSTIEYPQWAVQTRGTDLCMPATAI